MPLLRRFTVSVPFALLAACATHNGPAPLPSAPVRSWQVRASDGGSAQIYFRNDAATQQTVSMITLLRCANTREPCGDYPVHLVLEPGQKVVGMKVQRFATNRSWSFGTSYQLDRVAGAANPVSKNTPRPRMLNADEVRNINVEEFLPAVRAMTSFGTCGTMGRAILSTKERALAMFFSPSKRSPPERMVSVIYDTSGTAISYNDQRGDIVTKDPSHPDVPRAHPRTTIALNLAAENGMLHNDGGGLSEPWNHVVGANLTNAASLGRPAELIARIWKECRK